MVIKNIQTHSNCPEISESMRQFVLLLFIYGRIRSAPGRQKSYFLVLSACPLERRRLLAQERWKTIGVSFKRYPQISSKMLEVNGKR